MMVSSTTATELPWIIGDPGTVCENSNAIISTFQECVIAHEALGLEYDIPLESTNAEKPAGCSTRQFQDGSPNLHFNDTFPGIVGFACDDIRPICKNIWESLIDDDSSRDLTTNDHMIAMMIDEHSDNHDSSLDSTTNDHMIAMMIDEHSDNHHSSFDPTTNDSLIARMLNGLADDDDSPFDPTMQNENSDDDVVVIDHHDLPEVPIGVESNHQLNHVLDQTFQNISQHPNVLIRHAGNLSSALVQRLQDLSHQDFNVQIGDSCFSISGDFNTERNGNELKAELKCHLNAQSMTLLNLVGNVKFNPNDDNRIAAFCCDVSIFTEASRMILVDTNFSTEPAQLRISCTMGFQTITARPFSKLNAEFVLSQANYNELIKAKMFIPLFKFKSEHQPVTNLEREVEMGPDHQMGSFSMDSNFNFEVTMPLPQFPQIRVSMVFQLDKIVDEVKKHVPVPILPMIIAREAMKVIKDVIKQILVPLDECTDMICESLFELFERENDLETYLKMLVKMLPDLWKKIVEKLVFHFATGRVNPMRIVHDRVSDAIDEIPDPVARDVVHHAHNVTRVPLEAVDGVRQEVVENITNPQRLIDDPARVVQMIPAVQAVNAVRRLFNF